MRLLAVALAASLLSALPGVAAAQFIRTVAGTGVAGFSGDGGKATAAQLDLPSGSAVDAAGNLYIADQQNHRIRRVDATTKTITTVAGTTIVNPDGTLLDAGFNGDGIAAIGALLNFPTGVALDATGDNLFIADTHNQRVRRVCLNPGGCGATAGSPALAAGLITTVAGTGSIAAALTGGPLGNGGPATAANLYNPTGVAVDYAGNLHIADSINQQVRMVDATGQITAFAGTGVAGFGGDGSAATGAQLNSPLSVAIGGAGDVFIADNGNNRVRVVCGSESGVSVCNELLSGDITTLAGIGVAGFSGDGGPATAAQLNSPSGVAADGAGDVFIADLSNNAIREVSEGNIFTLVGGPEESPLSFPYGVAVDGSGSVFIADQQNQKIKECCFD